MNSVESQATILSLLTISTNEVETVFFAFCKEVDDVAPKEIHWYKSLGKDGLANFIWADKSIKQWLLIGSDIDVQAIWKELLDNTSYVQNWTNSSVTFVLSKVIMIEKGVNHLAIEGVDVCGRNSYPDEYESDNSPLDLSFLLEEDNNCAFIEGYKFHDKIKPINPPGLIGMNNLKRSLEKGVSAVFEKRSIYWHLRGDRTTAIGGDPINYKGFLQASKEFKSSYRICIRSLDGNEVLGTSDIGLDGRWEVKLTKPAFRGQFLIQEKQTETFICGEKFYLLKDIQINTEITSIVLTDLFGRTMSVGKKEKSNSELDSLIWIANNAPDTNQSQIELSDKLTNIISSLGKKIIFNDPYFWGDLKEINGQLDTSVSQKIFLNALITSISKTEIEEISIIGYWKRASSQITADKIELERKYRIIYSLIKRTFEKSNVLALKRFDLIFSNEPFHDRYWVGEDNVYHVSNSINGAFESGELRILKENQLGRLKIIPRIINRQNNGDSINLIS